MYINRKSSLYASPRNELHVGNESGESHWFTCLTGIVIVAVLIALLLAFITFSSSSAKGLPVIAHCRIAGMNYPTLHTGMGLHPACTPNPVTENSRPDNAGNEQNDTESTFMPASTFVVSNEPIVETVAEVVNNEPVQNDTPAPAELGNPGNDKNVGHSGEHCNQGMCENGDSGSRGNSQP